MNTRTNPKYVQNPELDAKIMAAAQVGGAQGMLKVMSEMKLWQTPADAVAYAKNIKLQPEDYKRRVATLAAQMAALVQQ